MQEDKFKARLVRTENGCLEWRGAKDKDGYGVVGYIAPGGRKTTMRAHRFAYLLAHGSIPEGKRICHRCDNPPCCDVEHLFPGTHAENMQDMTAKGRRVGKNAGEKHGRAKLTEAQVSEIKKLERRGVKQVDLAKEFGVSTTAIGCIVSGKTWGWVD